MRLLLSQDFLVIIIIKNKEQEMPGNGVLLFLLLFCQITTKGLHYLKDKTEGAWAGATSHEK